MKFKVWCYDKKEWETDITFLAPDGNLLQKINGQFVPVQKGGHQIVKFLNAKDKTGKEVYEGDVLKTDYGRIWVVGLNSFYGAGVSRRIGSRKCASEVAF